MVNRYYAFAGERYYPAGGMNDFLMSSNSLEECIEACKKFYNHYENAENNHELWTSIWDMENHFEIAMVWDQVVIYDSNSKIISTQDYEWTTAE